MTQPCSQLTLSVCLHFRTAERWMRDTWRDGKKEREEQEGKDETPHTEVEAAAAQETSGRLEADV